VSYYQDDWSEFLPMMDFAQLILPHDSLGSIAPFEVIHGYPARTNWDWKVDLPNSAPPNDKLNYEDARKYAARHHKAWTLAKSHILQAQDKMRASHNRSRRPDNFQVGQYVWLDMRQFPTARPSRKLDLPTNGPFKILEKVYNSYKLELPDSMKAHNVFSADKLRLAASDPLEGQTQQELPPINITGDEEYEVEEVLACRRQRGNLSYRVTWLNRDVDLTWYPASNLKYAPHKLKAFHLSNADQAGPPAKLPQWLEAWEQGVDDYDELDDDKEMLGRSRTSFFRRGG